VTLEMRALGAADAYEARGAHSELADEGFDLLPFFDGGEAWDQYLMRIARLRCGEGHAHGLVPWSDVYGVVNGVVVGRVSVRHQLTESPERVGCHIGYGVRPAYRRRGYATNLLQVGPAVACDLGIVRTLVTRNDANVGSAAVIERCGGVLADVTEVDGALGRRYWVPMR
jgi:predicted acetyltransferase